MSTFRSTLSLAVVSSLTFVLWTPSLYGQTVESAPPNALDALFRQLALDLLPHEYEDADDWGKTKTFVTGWDIERDGLKIETRRKRRPRNHGRWEKYSVKLANEDDFHVDVRDVHADADGKTAFTISVSAPLEVHIRRANWRRGLQLWSISADASANVEITLQCTASMHIDPTELPPAVVLRPEVVGAEIRMTQFRLRRISKLGSDVADEIGDALRGYVQRRAAEKGDKIAAKLNQKIEKNQDKLRLSLSDLASTKLLNATPQPQGNRGG